MKANSHQNPLTFRLSWLFASAVIGCVSTVALANGVPCGPWTSETCLPSFQHRLTAGAGGGGWTSVSAGGTRIAFASTHGPVAGLNLDHNSEVFLHDTAQGKFWQLTQTKNSDGVNSNWTRISADGRRIVFASNGELDPATGPGRDNADGSRELFLIRAPLGHPAEANPVPRQITNNPIPGFDIDIGLPDINADGTRIVFVSNANLVGSNSDGNHEIFLAEVSLDDFSPSVTLVQVTNILDPSKKKKSFFPRINGDGTRIVFWTNAQQGGCNADGSREIVLYDTVSKSYRYLTDRVVLGPNDGDFLVASIDSSGDLVAFTAHEPQTGADQIFLCNDAIAGSDPCVPSGITRITNLPPAPGNDRLEFPEISADGTRIAFATTRAVNGCNTAHHRELFLIDIKDPANPQFVQLSSAKQPNNEEVNGYAINADGTRVSYFYTEGGLEPDLTQLFLARCDDPGRCAELIGTIYYAFLCLGLDFRMEEPPDDGTVDVPPPYAALRRMVVLRFFSPDGTEIQTLPQPYELRRPFALEEVREAGIVDPESLAFYSLAGTRWFRVPQSWVDLERQEVVAHLDFGGTFAVLGLREEAGGVQKPLDQNQDGTLDISDPVAILGYLFLGTSPRLPCGDGSATDPANIRLLDASGDGQIDISDAIWTLSFLFVGRSPPSACSGPACPCMSVPGCPELPAGRGCAGPSPLRA